LQACRCELIKDVPGYFTSDPHQDTDAHPISQLTFEQALEFANTGCDLVQRKAIEAARGCALPLVIRSLNENEPMSRIVDIEVAASVTSEIPSALEAF
jgi:aspartokinase